MSNTDNIDKFGHCVICHKNLITKRIVDGKQIDMFLPVHGHTDFLLDNGSIMKVCICTPCKETTDLTDLNIQSNIMEACMKGWELETKILVADETQPMWTEEFGKKYLDTMAKRSIDLHTDNLTKETIQNRVKELTNVID